MLGFIFAAAAGTSQKKKKQIKTSNAEGHSEGEDVYFDSPFILVLCSSPR